MNTALWSLLLTLVAALATVIGGLVVVAPGGRLRDDRLAHLIGFGAGFMLSTALLKMMPESMALVAMAPAWILAGYVLAHLFEHTFTPHFHFGEETHVEPHLLSGAVSVSAFVGLALHAVFDGVSISSGFLISPTLGVVIGLAVILHKVPEGVTMASVMVAAGRERRAAITSTVVLALATIFGAVAMLALTPLKGIALGLSAGITMYVAATDLVPELNKLKEMRFSLSVLLGVVFFFVVSLALERLGIG